jgi:hypothetical protein
VANTLKLYRNGAVSFIDWLGTLFIVFSCGDCGGAGLSASMICSTTTTARSQSGFARQSGGQNTSPGSAERSSIVCTGRAKFKAEAFANQA